MQYPTDIHAAFSIVRDASDVLERLLEGGHSIIAGRLAGAFRNIERDRIANNILETMRAAGYKIHESDPFETKISAVFCTSEQSPIASRICLM